MTDKNINRRGDELENKILDVAGIALAHAKKLGASAAEVNIGQGQGISVNVRNGEIETVEHNRDKGLDITVYFDKRKGGASTSDLAHAAIESSVAAACNIAKHTEADACNGLADAELLATEFPDLNLFHPWPVAMDEAIDIANKCETAARDYDRRITNSEGASLNTHQGLSLYANSNGFCGVRRSSNHGMSCAVVAGEGGGMQRDYWFDSARDCKDLAAPTAVGITASERTIARLGARKIPTGEYAVIFEPQVASSLLGHFIAAISGGALYRKASFLLNHKGKKVFPDYIRIHEQPHLLKSPGAATFDSEGVATRARDLVTAGILQGYVLNSYTARKLKTQTTANAGGVRNLKIEATGDAELPELIKQMGRGLVVRELIGFGVNTVTGDYSRGAFGFWVEDGEIRYAVQECTIAGNLAQMYKDIVAVGKDADPRSNFLSGSILINKMTVAGK